MDYQHYIDEKIHQLRVVCRAQWDYLSYSDARTWLDSNFPNDPEGEYYATKILLHTIYYKKKDIEKLLNYGLNEKIYGEIIKTDLISKENVYISHSEAEAQVHRLKEATFFIPLLDSKKPSESGNMITGDLVHKLSISQEQVDFHWNVTEEKLKDFKLLVFVDDSIGSGNQLKKFWNSEEIQSINKICTKHRIAIYYLVVVGYDQNLKRLKDSNKLNGIQIIVCDILTDKNRIFSEENTVWDHETNELDKATSYFEKIRKQKGASFLGYKKLDFAIILHDRLPNWSLPLFWKETSNWNTLIKRKTS